MPKSRNRGFSPDKSIHYHLPHFDIENHYQFITFRTQDSKDKYLEKLSLQNLPNSKLQFKIDQYLDKSPNGCYLSNEILILMGDFIKSKNGHLYELIAYCIMPNHVHILFKPLHPLPKVMQILKGSSSKLINEALGKTGKFWTTNYYDKLIRDENHFNTVYKYIKNNPLVLAEASASVPRFFGIYE